MSILETLYRSPCGRLMSAVARLLFRLQKPIMLYGYTDPATRRFRKFVRMSSTATIVETEKLAIGDHVWVWHHTILDATGGLEIGEGCQIGAWVGVFTHGSHDAIRLLGKRFIDLPNTERDGYVRKTVKIAPYTFIASGVVILPGITIGKGCIIGSNCLVMSDVPDHSVMLATPGRVTGNTLRTDAMLLQKHDFAATYYDPDLLLQLRQFIQEGNDGRK